MADADSFMVVRALFNLDDGHLPLTGGWAEQPGKLMRLVEIAARERSKILESQQTEGVSGG